MKQKKAYMLFAALLLVTVLFAGCTQLFVHTLTTSDAVTGKPFSLAIAKWFGWHTDKEGFPYMLVKMEPAPFQNIKENVIKKNPSYIFKDYGERFLLIQEAENTKEVYLLTGADNMMNIWVTSPKMALRSMGKEIGYEVYFPVHYIDWSNRDFSEYTGGFLMDTDTGYTVTQSPEEFRAFYAGRPEIQIQDTENGFQFSYQSSNGKAYQYTLQFSLAEDNTYVMTISQ